VLQKAAEMMNPPAPARMVSRPQMQAIVQGQKIRAVRNMIHFRPLEETFYDFQLNLLFWALGEEWYDEQMRKPQVERHVILKWRGERNELLKKYRKPSAAPNEPISAPLTGNVKALQVLADDVYQLEHALETPKKIMQRLGNLRNRRSRSAGPRRAGLDMDILLKGQTTPSVQWEKASRVHQIPTRKVTASG